MFKQPGKHLQKVLREEIPLTRAMGLEVVRYTGDSLSLKAPLAPNTNHKSTAFGGSLYSVAVLSGWGLVYLLLREHDLKGHVVIQESHTRFLRPVDDEISAQCSFASSDQVQRFLNTYRRKGLARLKLESQVTSQGSVKLVFNGSYVVHR